MPYVCYDCQIIFQSRKANCPFCGGRIYSDEKNVSTLQNEGFTLSDTIATPNKATTDTSDDFHIDDSDILSSLRRSYDREHRRANQTNDTGSAGTPHRNNVQPTTQNSSQTMSQTRSGTREATSSPDDFFSQFQTSASPASNIPTIGTPSDNHTPATTTTGTGIGNDTRPETRRQRRARNSYRRLAIMNFLRNINWRIVFGVIVVIAVIVGLVVLWTMRFVIIESITNFLISLIPTLILLALIWYFIKKLFK